MVLRHRGSLGNECGSARSDKRAGFADRLYLTRTTLPLATSAPSHRSW